MTYLEEVTQAAQGCVAVLRGDRDGPEYFDLTLHGLMGSLIALVVSVALQSLLPAPDGGQDALLSPLGELLFVFVVVASWILILFGILRAMRRADRLVPFLVVNNWGSSFASLVLVGLSLVGLGGLLATFVLGAVSLYYSARAAWMVIDQRVSAIAAVIGAQLAAALVSVVLLGLIMPQATQ